MDGTWRFWRTVRTDSSRKRKLLEKSEHARFIAAFFRIDFRVVAFEIAVGQRCWCAVARARNVNDIHLVFLNDSIQVDPNEGLTGIRTPMSQEPSLEVFRL